MQPQAKANSVWSGRGHFGRCEVFLFFIFSRFLIFFFLLKNKKRFWRRRRLEKMHKARMTIIKRSWGGGEECGKERSQATTSS